MVSNLRVITADNDAIIRSMGLLPEGYVVNDYLTDTDHSSSKLTLRMVQTRSVWLSHLEPDFDTGNMR